VLFPSMMCIATAQHYTDDAEADYGDYDYVMDKVYYQSEVEEGVGKNEYEFDYSDSHNPAVGLGQSNRNHKLAGSNQHLQSQRERNNHNHHQRGHQGGIRQHGGRHQNPGQRYQENIGFTKDTFNGPNRNNLHLDRGFFDKNFPGEVNSNEQPFYGGPDNTFQNDHLHNHHRDPNADIHVANNQFLPNQIRLKRNKNRFNGNNQQQFQTGQVGGHDNFEQQSQQNQNQGGNPSFHHNFDGHHHQQEDVLDKGPLLTDLVFRQGHPPPQNYGDEHRQHLGQGLGFRQPNIQANLYPGSQASPVFSGNQATLPRNRNRPRFKKNTAGFLGLGNIVSVRWS